MAVKVLLECVSLLAVRGLATPILNEGLGRYTRNEKGSDSWFMCPLF